MKQLEELEKKISQVVQKNKDLQSECGELKSQVKHLQAQNEELQLSVMKENSATVSLAQEKDTIKSTIDELLASLNSLEKAER